MTPRIRSFLLMLLPIVALGGCADDPTRTEGEPASDAGIVERRDAAKPSAPKADAADTSCPSASAHIEVDVDFFGDRGTVHFSADAKQSFDSFGTALTAFAPVDAGIGFPFGVGVGFPPENVAANETYPLSIADKLTLAVIYEDSTKTGRQISIINQGTITFSKVGTGDCEPTVGTFENARGVSDGPNHPFDVRVSGSFRTATGP